VRLPPRGAVAAPSQADCHHQSGVHNHGVEVSARLQWCKGVVTLWCFAAAVNAVACDRNRSRGKPIRLGDSAGVTVMVVDRDHASASPDTIYPYARSALDLPTTDVSDARMVSPLTFALLDAQIGDAWLVGPESEWRKFLREGSGPGQAQRPMAIAATRTHIYVLDAGRGQVHVFELQGRYDTSISLGDAGDLTAIRRRFDREFEDYHLRLKATTEEAYLYFEDNEFAGTLNNRGAVETTRQAHVVRLARGTDVLDTIVSVPAQNRTVIPHTPSYGQPAFAARPLWGVSDSLFVYASSGTAEVRAYRADGTLRAVVRWRAHAHRVTSADRLAYVRSAAREQLPRQPREVRDAWTDPGRLRTAAEMLQTAEWLPEISGLEAVGVCVWLSNVDIDVGTNGIGRRWTYYNIGTGEMGDVQIDTSRVMPLSVTAGGIVARHRNSDGVATARAYALPRRAVATCGTKRTESGPGM